MVCLVDYAPATDRQERQGEVFGCIPHGARAYAAAGELLWQFTEVIMCDPVDTKKQIHAKRPKNLRKIL